MEKELKRIIKQVSEEFRVELIEVETDTDHVHLLVDCDPQFGVAQYVKLLKGRSSKLLREKFQHLRTKLPTMWTNSYFISTVGGSPLEVIKKYIQNQQVSQRAVEKAKWDRYLHEINK